VDLSDLNPEQLQAVLHNEGPMLVVAGAGTGKTSVISHRIARLVLEGVAKPGQVLALTFTDKAAGEMQHRLDGLLGWKAHEVLAMTFNAFGQQLISRFGNHVGMKTNLEVASPTTMLVLLEQGLSKTTLEYYGPQQDKWSFLENQLSYFGLLQNAGVTPESFRRFVVGMVPAPDLHALDIAELRDRATLYELYDRLKFENGLIDYNDQLRIPLSILQHKPNVLSKLQNEIKYILVDEYQDTNADQNSLLKLLVPRGGNIFAVGDDDQSIYGFRGARIGNILQFSEHFGVSSIASLTTNYRSTQQILDASYRLILHNNPDRLETILSIDKRLKGASGGSEPVYLRCGTAGDEVMQVSSQIAELVDGGVGANSIAVLAPTHTTLKAMAKKLNTLGVEYSLSTRQDVFTQPEMTQLWHLLCWIAGLASDEAIAQVLLGPFFRCQIGDVSTLSYTAVNTESSFEKQLSRTTSQWATNALSRVHGWRSASSSATVSTLVYDILFEGGYVREWSGMVVEQPRIIEVFQDLKLLLQHMQDFELGSTDQSLASYLRVFPKQPEIESERLGGEKAGVSLLTVHAAKGLEFDRVFIMNNTADAWSGEVMRFTKLPPGLTDDASDDGVSEKRRLLYVAMTRARASLFLSFSTSTQKGKTRRPSLFMGEVFGQVAVERVVQQAPDHRFDEALNYLQRNVLDRHKWPSLRLPFIAEDGWASLSVSQLADYDRCPYDFFVQHVLCIRRQPGPMLAFGSNLHSAIEHYYRLRMEGEEVKLDYIIELLQSCWSNNGYTSEMESKTAFQRATIAISRFYDREQAENRVIRSVEEPFIYTLTDEKIRIRGRIDATFVIDDGIEIRDFKTGVKHKQASLDRQAKSSLQLRTYALSLLEQEGIETKRVVLDYIMTGSEGVAELSSRVLDGHRDKLTKMVSRMKNWQFDPSSSSQHNCHYEKYWGKDYDER
jgi:DNA helicase II / ATP-dependent DNA helicase PcrA